MLKPIQRVAALVAIGGLVVGCSNGGASSGGSGPQTVQATEKEWQISLENASFHSGSLTIKVHNDGDKEHEFIIRKTDLTSDKLPVNSDGEVVEDDPQLTEVGDPSEIGSVKPGEDQSITLANLAPGHYVIFCNIHDQDLLHYQKGMHTDFTVS